MNILLVSIHADFQKTLKQMTGINVGDDNLTTYKAYYKMFNDRSVWESDSLLKNTSRILAFKQWECYLKKTLETNLDKSIKFNFHKPGVIITSFP